MWIVRGENRYRVVVVDRDVLTLSNRYGAEFEVDIAALVANGYRLECEQGDAIPVWWLDVQGDVETETDLEPAIDPGPVEKPKPSSVQPAEKGVDVFALFDF